MCIVFWHKSYKYVQLTSSEDEEIPMVVACSFVKWEKRHNAHESTQFCLLLYFSLMLNSWRRYVEKP